MALLRAYIDQTTLAGQTTLQTNTFLHGLPGTPHHVFIRYVASLTNGATGISANWWGGIAAVNATGVTIQNPGNQTGPAMEVTSIMFHSIIQ